MNKIKAFVEQMIHRLQGHLLVTYQDGLEYKTVYAMDVHSWDDGIDYHSKYLCVDLCDETHFYLDLANDVTITGA